MRVLTGAAPNENITDADLAELYAPPAGQPWLRVGMVSTVDGSATGDDARTASINNAADRRVFQTLRSLADVIIVGAGTAKAEKYAPTDVPIVLVSRKAQVPESLQGAPAGSVYLATCSRSDGLPAAREILGDEQILGAGRRSCAGAGRTCRGTWSFRDASTRSLPPLCRGLLPAPIRGPRRARRSTCRWSSPCCWRTPARSSGAGRSGAERAATCCRCPRSVGCRGAGGCGSA